MADRDDLKLWVVQALKSMGGKGSIVDICRHIWENHEAELKASGDLFYTWQYDMRWAGQRLRDDRKLDPPSGRLWRLASAS